jgi:polar amino acid transport system substrate-binding protein
MKKTYTLKAFASLLMAVSLTACSSVSAGSSSSASSAKTGTKSTYAYLLDTTDLPMADLDLSDADGDLKTILDNGVLKVSTSPDYPAAEFVDDEGKVWGSEMMLAKYIADNLGVDLDIETMDFNATLTAVSTGKTDLAISGFGWKKDREENFSLSVGYSGDSEAAVHTLLVPADTADDYTSLDDFSGKHILAQSASLQEMYVEDEIPDADLELVTTIDIAILSLTSGKCDAVALDEDTAESYAEQSDGKLAVSSVKFDLSAYGDYQGNVCAAAKGEDSLTDAVNKIINTAADNGLYAEWYKEAKKKAGID